MASLNKTQFIGNLGAAPELRHTPGGTAVATVNIATTAKWKNRETGELMERTDWHRLVFWGRLAAIAADHLRKGSQIFVEGSNQTREWEDKDGVKRWTTEVHVDDLQMLGSKPQGN